jgi:hypothetical protein
MTTTTTETADAILADFNRLRTEIEARKPGVGNYVLRWFFEGSSLYVGKDATGSYRAVGFNRAAFFGDRQAAVDFLRRTEIRNGHGQHPVALNAFNAKQGALIDIDKVIAGFSAAIANAKREA